MRSALAQRALAFSLVGALSACGGASHRHLRPGPAHPPDKDEIIAPRPANGVSSESAAEILAAATRAIDRTGAVHVSGSTPAGGPGAIDLGLVAGKGARGALGTPGSGLELIRVGSVLYLRAAGGAWPRYLPAPAPNAAAGGWWQVPAASPAVAALAPLADARTLFATLLSGQLSVHDRLVREMFRSVDGDVVVAVHDEATGATLQVATEGPPYPVMLLAGGPRRRAVAFDDFDQPAALTAPSGALPLPERR